MAPDPDPKPEKPRAPETWECCQSGCEPCVYDRYWEALTNYELALQAWESRHPLSQTDPQKDNN